MKIIAAYLSILLTLLLVSIPSADGAAVKAVNDMGDTIVSLECVLPDKSTKKVMGLVADGRSSVVDLEGCDRVVLRWESLVTQFFIEEPIVDGQILTFSFNSLDIEATQRHPVLSVKNLNAEKIIPGGLPFDMLLYAVEGGLTQHTLNELLPPAGRPVRDPKKYAVSLAESSWRILYDSLDFGTGKDDLDFLRSLTIASDYTSPVVLMTLAHLKKIGADPYLALTDSGVLPLRDDAFSNPDYAATADNTLETDTFQKRWNAVDIVLTDIATGSRTSTGIVFIFTTEKIRYEFTLNFSTAMALLKIVRV